jgi:site-specific DNA-adenine methylase
VSVDTLKVTTIVPYFGSNRLCAADVGAALAGCEWVGVPFLGGGSELAHIRSRTVVASDLHRHVINLANVLRHPHLGPMLIRDLRRLPFHADQLRHAQDHCLRVETRGFADDPETEGMGTSYADALNYFVCAWMGRSGKSGTRGEFQGALPVRWNANGGDSAVRFRSAVESLRDWRRVLARVNFVAMDAFAFLAKCKDESGVGVYCDPPFPDAGEEYRHSLSHDQHRRLARTLSAFARARVVCRFYDHPLIRELYPEPGWRWLYPRGGKKQTNAAAPEVLLTRNQQTPERVK